MRARWIGWGLAAGLACVGLAATLVQGPPRAEAKPASLADAVEHVMKTLRENDAGLRPGIHNVLVPLQMKGAAVGAGVHVLSLADSPYAPPGDWEGTL